MSIQVMTAVWQYSAAKSGALLVQLALADFSNDEGLAFPAIQTLGRKARLSPRQVKRALNLLQRLGELTVIKKQGPHGVNIYRITRGDVLSPAQPLEVPLKNSESDSFGESVVTPATPNSLRNPSKIRKEEREISGEPVKSVDTVDNSVVDRDDHGEVATVGEGAKDLIGNQFNFISPGLQEFFSKHLELDDHELEDDENR
jgi:hypothetical protein